MDTNSGAAALSGASVVMETRSDRVGVRAHVMRWESSNTQRLPIRITSHTPRLQNAHLDT